MTRVCKELLSDAEGIETLLLMLGQQRFNLVVRFVADRVDLRGRGLAS
jgi:hypothetical protein